LTDPTDAVVPPPSFQFLPASGFGVDIPPLDFSACDFGSSMVSNNKTGLPGTTPSTQQLFLEMMNSWDGVGSMSNVDALTAPGLLAIPFVTTPFTMSPMFTHELPLLSSAPL
jgi:hypothetical protein